MGLARSSDGGMKVAKFPEKLIKLMHQQKVKQAELARLVGMSQSGISQMTRGHQEPYLWQAFALARALGTTTDYLADDGQEEPPMTNEPSPEEVAVLTAFRATGLSAVEAVRRLMQAAPRPDEGLVSYGERADRAPSRQKREA